MARNTTNAECDYIGNFILARGCKQVTFINECSDDWRIEFELPNDPHRLVHTVTPRQYVSSFFKLINSIGA